MKMIDILTANVPTQKHTFFTCFKDLKMCFLKFIEINCKVIFFHHLKIPGFPTDKTINIKL